MTCLIALMTIVGGLIFGANENVDTLIRVTSLWVAFVALLYLTTRSWMPGKRAVNERKRRNNIGRDNPSKTPASKHVDER